MITKAPVPANTEDCIEDGFPTRTREPAGVRCGDFLNSKDKYISSGSVSKVYVHRCNIINRICPAFM